jgi:hypothetical protein
MGTSFLGLFLQSVTKTGFDFALREGSMSCTSRSHSDTCHDQNQKHESPELGMLVHGVLPPEAEITIYSECKKRRPAGSSTLI